MRQKDESIIAKESQINQLKRRNQELEKFRVVFGFKLQKLAKDLGTDFNLFLSGVYFQFEKAVIL